MNKKISVFIACLFMTGISMAQGIEFFEGSWKEALAEAKAQEKLLFVDCYTTWCGPCKKMSSKVFTQNEVGAFYNENFVNLKLDMEKEDGRSFGLKYPVSAYPTMFFITGDGDVVYKIKGFKQAPAFIAEGEKAVSKYDRSGEYAESYEDGDRSYELMMDYVDALVKANKPSLKIANEYINSNPEITEEELAMFLYTASTESDSRIFEKMLSQKETIVAKVGEDAWKLKVLSACRKTVGNAIEYEYFELIDEAAGNVKNELGKKVAKRFECESCIAYFKSAGDYDSYFEYMEKFVNKYSKDDPIGLKWGMQELVTSFKDQTKNKELALKAAERLVKIEDKQENYLQYARLLDLNGEQDDAIKVLLKEREKAEKAGTTTIMIDRILNKIKAS